VVERHREVVAMGLAQVIEHEFGAVGEKR